MRLLEPDEGFSDGSLSSFCKPKPGLGKQAFSIARSSPEIALAPKRVFASRTSSSLNGDDVGQLCGPRPARSQSSHQQGQPAREAHLGSGTAFNQEPPLIANSLGFFRHQFAMRDYCLIIALRTMRLQREATEFDSQP